MKGLGEKKWFPYAVAACIAVAFYVVLANIGSITSGLLQFLSYFKVIFLGGIMAYVLNPLAMLFQRTVFANVGRAKLRWSLSIAASVILLIAIVGFILGTLIPQLAESAVMLVSNMDGYLASFRELVEKWGISKFLRIDQFVNSSGDVARQLQTYFTQNASSLVNASAAAGRSVVTTIIALILSVYMLSSKEGIKSSCKRFLNAAMPDNKYKSTVRFLSRCDKILVNYIVSSLLDALIVGVANAVFMALMGMQYIGLISVVVAVTNLIPTFGPIIGGAVGGFILLLVQPVHALIFIAFTFVLQFLDPYFIKPKLFGNTLGVSGLLILMSVLVCGRIWGIPGILIAIPLAAIVDFVYSEGILTALEKRKKDRQKKQPEAASE